MLKYWEMSIYLKKLEMRKIVRISLIMLGSIFLIIVIVCAIGCYLYLSSDYKEPDIKINKSDFPVTLIGDSIRICGNNSIILNKYGLWEAHINGNPAKRGAAYGALSEDLLKYQEKVFVDQIHDIIHSENWVKILHKFIGIFNRNMATYVPLEYREEIFALSSFCSNEYDVYGTPYIRQLNYHAAHDIGHMLQEYMLVGCSSFATWDSMSVDGRLLIARNFDFYVGENFAKNKIILFVSPDKGYRFVSVTWPGMMGILSGMNEKGLTVTINAAKGAIPTSSTIPISLLTRQILQYASNIDEAYEIASKYQTFVSESILIGSALDHRAAIIEKSPVKIALYRPVGEELVCTNHYQSELFSKDKYNLENIANSDSPYRHKRLIKLINRLAPIDKYDAVSILRDSHGLNDEDIGLTNEKSLNQFIAHHSVVFSPEELKMWVSTSPWQLGEYICYDLNEIFTQDTTFYTSMIVDEFIIPADSNALVLDYPRVVKFRQQSNIIRKAISRSEKLPDGYIKDFIDNNPNFFQTYDIAGDYMLKIGRKKQALEFWSKALEKEISRTNERERIKNKIGKHD